MTKPLVSIQILNWNRAEDTQIAIQSALNQTYENIEIIVIDNGSSDDSVRLIRKKFSNIKLKKISGVQVEEILAYHIVMVISSSF